VSKVTSSRLIYLRSIVSATSDVSSYLRAPSGARDSCVIASACGSARIEARRPEDVSAVSGKSSNVVRRSIRHALFYCIDFGRR
jgi:hypothetical protein